MKIGKQLTIQLTPWFIGMVIDFAISGHIIIGGFVGLLAGFILVMVIAVKDSKK